jgi:hypothetical protein
VLKLDKPGALRIVGQATSQFPLETLEAIVNGQVVATTAAAEDPLRLAINQEIAIDQSGWIALRAKGRRPPGMQAPELFAHTSAVHVEVAGRPVRSASDAEYFIRWIQRLRDDVRQRNRIPAAQQAHVEQQISQALDFYRKLATPDSAADKGP